MLHLQPESVRLDLAVAGDTRPLDEILPHLITGGVAPVSANGVLAWQATAIGKNIDANAHLFAPPALGEQNIYLCSTEGHVIAMRQSDGSALFAYNTHAPIAFQPALADGRIFAGTADGRLICLNVREKDADGWYAWGGNAQHNRKF
jgi:outer membrane protein assembly factor BamB